MLLNSFLVKYGKRIHRRIQIIAIHKSDILPFSNGHAIIACRTGTCRFVMMDDGNPGVLGCVGFGNGIASIRRCVINDDDFDIA